MQKEIYNPKDIWHRSYFIEWKWDFYRNDVWQTACALSEKDYEKMCGIKNINPLYLKSISTVITL